MAERKRRRFLGEGGDLKTHHGQLIWSTQYRYGTVICTGQAGGQPRLFRKFYRYLDTHVARYEYECARTVFEQGIPTPRPLRLVAHPTFGSGIEFAWVELDPVGALPPALLARDLLALVYRFHQARRPDSCRHWRTLVASEYAPELARTQAWCRGQGEHQALHALDLATRTFKNLAADGIVHGDLSPANIAYVGRILYCLDFRHVSTGPRGWDIGYFLCHLAPDEPMAQALLQTGGGECAIDLAIVSSAIKLGRRLRRGDDPTPGWQRLLAWIGEKQRRPVPPKHTGLSDAASDRIQGRAFVQATGLPGAASTHLGLALLRHGLLDRSQSIFAAISAAGLPQRHAAELNLAVILHVRGQFEQARAAYEALLPEVEQRHVAGVYLNLGVLHLQLRDPDTSLTWLERARHQAPENVAVAAAKLAWYHSFRRYCDGIEAFEHLRALYPGHALTAVICNTGANLFSAAGQWERARACWSDARAFDPDYWNAATNHAFASFNRVRTEELLGDVDSSLKKRTAYFPPRDLAPRAAYRRGPSEVLRIGIVSSRIRRGKVGYLLRAVLSNLDRERFQIHVYDNAVCIDRFSAPLQPMAAQWRSVFGWSATALARHIHSDEVDVLLDLDGHGPRNFGLALWMQPAPLQLGLGPFSAPGISHDDPALMEALDGLYAFDEPVTLSHARVERTGLRLAYVGDADKLDAETLSVLCLVLLHIPSATLTLKSLDFVDDKLVNRVRRHFSDAGIDEARLRFVGFIKGHRHHLAFHQELDLLIDAVNRSSQIAQYEALQHGVPVLALQSAAQPLTGGAQLLRALGLPYLVADDVHALVALCRCAADEGVLAAWRAAAREALVRHQRSLGERARRFGERIMTLHRLAAPAAGRVRIDEDNRHEMESFDGDGNCLLLTSCFGDHVPLSVFDE